ncbi:MAG: glucose-1-phosphate adenylyltransferase subunit GlgD [Clostridia bacterium]|nr:glucose-1-phosphate adenylyltransferase subunit GlgD [Clostridia bacterium]
MGANKAMGILFAYVNEKRVSELTKERVIASIPFGARYRLVDFPLSNLVNSGVKKVGVITEQNYQSLMDHLGSGKAWDLSRKNEGLFLLPPFGADHSRNDGKVESLHSIKVYLESSREEYVILSDCDYVANVDYADALEFHIANEADVTAIYRRGTAVEGLMENVYTIDPENRIRETMVTEKGINNANIGMGMYIFRREYLLDVIEECYGKNILDFDRVVMSMLVKDAKVFGYEFGGTALQITSLASYFEANLALMDPKVRNELFMNPKQPIYTKNRDDMPAKYGLGSNVQNSLVADGTVIDGEVENCVIFRGAVIGKGAKLKNCVIMQDTVVGDNCELNYVVADKNVIIESGRKLAGYDTYPVYIAKRSKV